ncbi:MAG: LamG domain-containing protein, partial [Candidatus Aenigmatarchaeota archaeon]
RIVGPGIDQFIPAQSPEITITTTSIQDTSTVTTSSITTTTVQPGQPNPMMLFHLDESTSPFADSIGNAEGICTDACPSTTAGVLNGALSFDNSIVTINQNSLISEVGSIELWLKTYDASRMQIVFYTGCNDASAGWPEGRCKGDSSNGFGGTQELEITIGNGQLLFLWDDEQKESTRIMHEITSNTWYHVVGVYKNGDYMKLYVNAELVAQNLSIPIFSTTAQPLPAFSGTHWYNISFIGMPPSDPSRNLFGDIDELRIYNYTLTDQEVLGAYNQYTR